MTRAVPPQDVEHFRALLPVGYAAGVRAYRQAVAAIDEHALTRHYTDGLAFFHEQFVPHLKHTLHELTGGAWSLDDYVAFSAGSDVDLMAHLIDAVAATEPVSVFPGDWFGFGIGSAHPHNVRPDATGAAPLACLCLPSVRNGHLTQEMLEFLDAADACLLNVNLFPTLPADERHASALALALAGMLPKSILSISFSRGFGLTASQLGVVLLHRDHPYRHRFQRQLDWFTFFHNAIAARAFMAIDIPELRRVDAARRLWVAQWLRDRNLPVVETGTYYVKSFRIDGTPPDYLTPLIRHGVTRLCFKPPITA